MKKHLLIVLALIAMVLSFSSCAHEHAWSEWTTTTEATCTVDGEQTRTCECGEKETKPIAAKGHSEWSEWVTTTAATCTMDGEQTKTCECGKKETRPIAATGHIAGAEATCTKTQTCTACNAVLVSALGHKPGAAATCTTAQTCTVCKEELVAAGHKPGAAATCTTAQSCTVCKVELAGAKGHTPGKVATCTTAQTCTICRAEVAPAKGHTPGTAATCTTEQKCTACNTVIVAALGHKYVSGACERCKAKDPNAPFKAGETWTVDGQFEFTLVEVNEHDFCNSFLDDYGFNKNQQIVMLKIKYKNIGYTGTFAPKFSNIKVLDGEDEIARLYSSSQAFIYGCDHATDDDAYPECSDGMAGSILIPYALNNKSTSLSVVITIKDANGVERTAKFTSAIMPKPAEPEEDELNGCTVTVDASLPTTINYYSSNRLQSSCSVTEVSFKVSGDDLYIYFTGKKTYDSRGSGQSDSCKIGWKLYDDKNNVIANGVEYTLGIAVGEGFVKSAATAYNCITSGGTYKLVLLNVN